VGTHTITASVVDSDGHEDSGTRVITVEEVASTFQVTVNNGSGDGVYAAGTQVDITADAAPSGQVFHQWTGDTAGVADINAATTQFTVPASNATLTASYTSASNQAPQGVNDVLSGAVLGQAFRVSVAALLANDVDHEGDALSIKGLDDALNGTLSIEGHDEPFYQVDIQSSDYILFTPTASGQGGFTYYVEDDFGFDLENMAALVHISISDASTNQAPTVSIQTPEDNAVFTVNDAVTLSASASDPEDGDITNSIRWQSSINGALAGGANLVTSALSAGTHILTANATDSEGLAANDQVSISITTGATPSLTLNPPSPSGTIEQGDTITLSGSATDSEDGDISHSIRWTSSVDASFDETGATVSTDQLNAGNHVITATVSDSDGNSTSDTLNVFVTSDVVTQSKFHVFGHSLFTHTFNNEGYLYEATDFTQAGNWLGLLAAADGHESVGSHTFGQVDSHNTLSWLDGDVSINGAYDTGNTTPFTGMFTNQHYTHFYLMPSNFRETDMGPPPFNSAVATAQAGFAALIDNIDRWYPQAEKLLYVHWHEFHGPNYGLGQDTPLPSIGRAQFTAYNNEVINEYLGWHISLQNALTANGRSIRTIPVGPVIAWLLENESYLQPLNFSDLYADGAPHGNENIYFLASLVVYRAVYQVNPNLSNFTVPSAATQIRPEIANNLASIVSAIETRLNVHNANGVRVWP